MPLFTELNGNMNTFVILGHLFGFPEVALRRCGVMACIAGGVKSEGASYALGFMNISTDKADKSLGFLQIMIVAVHETKARIEARRPSTSFIRSL